jgi:hypothetical protein
MHRTSIPLALSLFALAACATEAPVAPRVVPAAALSARTPVQTLYRFTLAGGLQSDVDHPFSALAKTGDPFSSGIDADGVYLVLPLSSGGTPAECDAGFTLGPSTGQWGAYSGLWVGHLTASVSISNRGTTGNLSYNATRSDGTGWIWLVLKGGTVVSSNGKMTVTFTNARGLVSAYSTPTGSFEPRVGPFDSDDRCLTFSFTALAS